MMHRAETCWYCEAPLDEPLPAWVGLCASCKNIPERVEALEYAISHRSAKGRG